MDLYLPAFPRLAADLGASEGAVQLTLTADVVGLVVGQLVLGPLSDARGRRGLLIGSTLVGAVASVLCALAPSAAWPTVWRLLQGASGGGGIVLARAVAADVSSGVAAARLSDLYGLSATRFRLVFALNAAGMIALGLLDARLVRRFPVRGLLVAGLVFSTVAALALLGAVLAGLGLVAVMVPLFLVVATRGLISSNATVLGVERAPVAGSASAVLGACMFAGGIVVTPLLTLGGEGSALPMVVVITGGAVAALLATTMLRSPARR